MTTRRKSQQDFAHQEFSRAWDGMEYDGDFPVDQPLDEGQRKRNGTSCVVPGCRVTGWSNPDVKWYRIPKVNERS